MKKQESLFRITDITGTLRPNIPQEPQSQNSAFKKQGPLTKHERYLNKQKSLGRENSAAAEQKFKESGRHIPQKKRIIDFMFAHQGSTLAEISEGTGIDQHGTITARFDDIRKDGYYVLPCGGHWTIKRIGD